MYQHIRCNQHLSIIDNNSQIAKQQYNLLTRAQTIFCQIFLVILISFVSSNMRDNSQMTSIYKSNFISPLPHPKKMIFGIRFWFFKANIFLFYHSQFFSILLPMQTIINIVLTLLQETGSMPPTIPNHPDIPHLNELIQHKNSRK